MTEQNRREARDVCEPGGPTLNRERRAEVFWARVSKTDRCWNWQGARSASGYGYFRWFGQNMYAHRLAYELTRGSLPDGVHVLHDCDNPSCVRPDHLRLGTHADNMRDRAERGRTARGTRITRSKLTEADVVRIRELRAAGVPQPDVARMFGTTPTNVRFIVERRTWKHVGGGVAP